MRQPISISLVHPSTSQKTISRWKAAALHLGISAIIAGGALALLFGLWYPPPYFHAAGADELSLLLVGVDLVLGPLLTLIVFRSGKSGMKFDLWAIGIVQSMALLYGMFVVLQSRPVFLVATIDRFVLVSANEISDADLALAPEAKFRSRSWTGARLAAAEMPIDLVQRSALMDAAFSGRDLQNQPRYFCDYQKVAPLLIARAHSLDELRQNDSAHLVNQWLAQHQRKATTVRWLPLMARKADLVLLLDAASGTPLEALPVVPPTW